ncbi:MULTISPECIES: DUF4296 domain-containing protein [unclassified Carboxylicivirga]|uniref:DUF4296 domain-containing protein n=1 Tax=Carboxylicivirga TaxID=1628153 RepID=UPI003D3532DB
MSRYFILFLLGAVLWSCSTRPKVPRHLADEERMTAVLADIYQLESVLSQTRLTYNSAKEDKVSGYYRNVLDKHGMSKADFDSAMVWYAAHPTVLSDVYEEVIEELSRRDAELKNKMNEEKEIKKDLPKVPSRVDLWADTTAFQVPFDEQDSLDNRVPFTFSVDSLSDGILRLQADYSFSETGLMDSARMKMVACYADSTADTVFYHIHKSFNTVKGNISHRINQRSLVVVKGLLFDHDTSKVSAVDIEAVKLTFIPTMGADALSLP